MTTTQPQRPRPFKADPDKVLAALKRKLNDREEWDELPELGFIYAERDNRVRTSALRTDDSMWQAAGDPKNVLRGFLHILAAQPSALAAEVARNLRRLAPEEFVGLYIRVEAWGPPDSLAEEVHRRKQAGSSIPRFETMEGSIEVRMGTAVDAEGMVYLMRQPRPTMQLEGFYSAGGPAQEGEPGEGRIGGELPVLLHKLLAALLTPSPEAEDTA